MRVFNNRGERVTVIVPSKREQRMGEIARAHPNWSIRQIEEYLDLKPANCASAFRKGTKQRAEEQRNYEERLQAWEMRRR